MTPSQSALRRRSPCEARARAGRRTGDGVFGDMSLGAEVLTKRPPANPRRGAGARQAGHRASGAGPPRPAGPPPRRAARAGRRSAEVVASLLVVREVEA